MYSRMPTLEWCTCILHVCHQTTLYNVHCTYLMRLHDSGGSLLCALRDALDDRDVLGGQVVLRPLLAHHRRVNFAPLGWPWRLLSVAVQPERLVKDGGLGVDLRGGGFGVFLCAGALGGGASLGHVDDVTGTLEVQPSPW